MIKINTIREWHTVDAMLLSHQSFDQNWELGIGEKQVLKKKKKINPSVWSEKYRVLKGNAMPGPMKNLYSPYMAGIIDSANHDAVNMLVMCKGVQATASEYVHSYAGFSTDMKPGPIKYVYPDEKTGRKQLKKRILPMFKNSPHLRKFLTGSINDENNLSIQLKHMMIDVGWSGSASSLAADDARLIIFDETNKYVKTASKDETDPISLGLARLKTWLKRNKALAILLSTPTTEDGYISVYLKKSQVIFDYFVRCPFCNQYQVMTMDQIKWDGGLKADCEKIEAEHLAHYECKCGEKWNDVLRDKAVQAGEWRSRGKELELFTYLDSFKPAKIGFVIPGWISYFTSLSACAAAYIKGETEGPTAKQNYDNNFAAQPTKEIVIESSVDKLLSHRTNIPKGVVPGESVALTCGVDMQMNGFYFVVRAWAPDLSNWLVQYNKIPDWDALQELIFDSKYPIQGSGGQTRGIWRAALDTGGGKKEDDDWSRTQEAYLWLKSVSPGKIYGIKGSSDHKFFEPVAYKNINKPKGHLKHIPGGVDLHFLDTNKLKTHLHWRLGRKEADETGQEAQDQRFYLHKDTCEEYAKQFLAEKKVLDRKTKKTYWKKAKNNHYFDCEVYAAACADDSWAPSLRYMINKKKPNKKKKIIVTKPTNINNILRR